MVIEVKSKTGLKPETIRRQRLFVPEVTMLLVLNRLPLIRASVKCHYNGTGTAI